MPLTIYDITAANQAIELIPVDKRNPFLISLWQALFAPFQWISSLWFGDYRTDSTAPDYTAGTYALGDRAIYNKVVYESLIDGNTDTPPSALWMVVQANFIGLSERIMYTGQTLTLTYALNKWFGTVFRQPNQSVISQVARATNVVTITATAHGYATNDIVSVSGLATAGFNGTFKITVTNANHFTYANTGSNVSATTDAGIGQHVSDIYLLTQANPISIFRATTTDASSSKVYTGSSSEYVFTDYNFGTLVNFTIFMPVATWTALAGNDNDRTAIVNGFVSGIVPSGIVWQTVTY